MKSYCAFLRGINVGGNKKVSMKELKTALENLGFVDVKTVLNSGNIIFSTETKDSQKVKELVEQCMESTFGFTSATTIRETKDLVDIQNSDPFKNCKTDSNTKLYITFIPITKDHIDHTKNSNGFCITHLADTEICTAIDMTKTGTIEVMNILEKHYGKEITTRTWNTVLKLLQ